MRGRGEIPNRTICEDSHILRQSVVLLGLVAADARLDATSFFVRRVRRFGAWGRFAVVRSAPRACKHQAQ